MNTMHRVNVWMDWCPCMESVPQNTGHSDYMHNANVNLWTDGCIDGSPSNRKEKLKSLNFRSAEAAITCLKEQNTLPAPPFGLFFSTHQADRLDRQSENFVERFPAKKHK